MKKIVVMLGMAFSMFVCFNYQSNEVQASGVTSEGQPSSMVVDMNLNKEQSKIVSDEQGTLMIEKNRLANNTRMNDGVYNLYYHSWDGRFNVGYQAVIANNQFIAVSDSWNQLYGVRVLYDTLTIDHPKQATYFLNIGNGWTQWNQYLRGTITGFNQLKVVLYKG